MEKCIDDQAFPVDGLGVIPSNVNPMSSEIPEFVSTFRLGGCEIPSIGFHRSIKTFHTQDDRSFARSTDINWICY